MLGANSVEAQDNESTVSYVTKIYNIAGLLDAPLMLGSEIESEGHKKQNAGAGQFGEGGAGGGGMFRIPENILPQMGGLGGGGLGGFGGGPAVATNFTTLDAMTLEQLVLDHVSDDDTQWYAVDGLGGRLSVVASMMIVTHTADVQARVVQFLDALRVANNTDPTVQVDVRIVEVASDQSVSSMTFDAKTTERLANDPSAARLSLRCNNHRVAKVSSGLRRSYVISLTPVVGSNGVSGTNTTRENNIGYHPVTYSPLLGLFGKIKPEIDADKKTGRILLGIELASGPEEVISATFGTGQSIDRVEIESARLETSIDAAAETWTLAGSVAVTSPTSSITSGEALPHLAILVRWTPVP
jgi:hypothetical protein